MFSLSMRDVNRVSVENVQDQVLVTVLFEVVFLLLLFFTDDILSVSICPLHIVPITHLHHYHTKLPLCFIPVNGVSQYEKEENLMAFSASARSGWTRAL